MVIFRNGFERVAVEGRGRWVKHVAGVKKVSFILRREGFRETPFPKINKINEIVIGCNIHQNLTMTFVRKMCLKFCYAQF